MVYSIRNFLRNSPSIYFYSICFQYISNSFSFMLDYTFEYFYTISIV